MPVTPPIAAKKIPPAPTPELVSIWDGRGPLPGFEDRPGFGSSLTQPVRVSTERDR